MADRSGRAQGSRLPAKRSGRGLGQARQRVGRSHPPRLCPRPQASGNPVSSWSRTSLWSSTATTTRCSTSTSQTAARGARFSSAATSATSTCHGPARAASAADSSPATSPNPEDDGWNEESALSLTDNGYEVSDAPPLDPVLRQETSPTSSSKACSGWSPEGGLRIVRTADELEGCLREGIIAAILHFEGAENLGPDPGALEELYEAGLRSLGLVWSRPNAYAHGVPFRFPSSPGHGAGPDRRGEGTRPGVQPARGPDRPLPHKREGILGRCRDSPMRRSWRPTRTPTPSAPPRATSRTGSSTPSGTLTGWSASNFAVGLPARGRRRVGRYAPGDGRAARRLSRRARRHRQGGLRLGLRRGEGP